MLEVTELATHIDDNRFEWSFEVPRNTLLAVVGGSGIGKSSLLNTLLGLRPAQSGTIHWCGQDVGRLALQQRPFGVLFQSHNLFDHLSVTTNLALGLVPSARLNAAQRKQLIAAAERFQLSEFLNQRASELSGGQQQRVALARVFLQNKPVLLLDEPFSSLDPALRADGLAWVKDMQREHGTTVILVTHHLTEMLRDVDSVLEGVSSTVWKQYPAR
ncbi:ATP-binding cassette domain-containing protein [Reinekea sp.]|jgi:thiamine transport system ATP-binding protein|uniref:thiamine ABC transporter ATP-binding protein n=1 Tax=Reinekea sp. TaxID=1970455 RepID=UPI002A82A85B|nr:ATP-binding cassette domain-containing protein [Reinekea sp.]